MAETETNDGLTFPGHQGGGFPPPPNRGLTSTRHAGSFPGQHGTSTSGHGATGPAAYSSANPGPGQGSKTGEEEPSAASGGGQGFQALQLQPLSQPLQSLGPLPGGTMGSFQGGQTMGQAGLSGTLGELMAGSFDAIDLSDHTDHGFSQSMSKFMADLPEATFDEKTLRDAAAREVASQHMASQHMAGQHMAGQHGHAAPGAQGSLGQGLTHGLSQSLGGVAGMGGGSMDGGESVARSGVPVGGAAVGGVPMGGVPMAGVPMGTMGTVGVGLEERRTGPGAPGASSLGAAPLGGPGSSSIGFKRKILTAEEKAQANRDRNREHARNTRLRKKAYVNKLTQLVADLTAKKEAKAQDQRMTVGESGVHTQRRQAIGRAFLEYRAAGVRDRRRWEAIVDEDFVLTLPITPYRYFNRGETCDSFRVITGIDALIADVQSCVPAPAPLAHHGWLVHGVYGVSLSV